MSFENDAKEFISDPSRTISGKLILGIPFWIMFIAGALTFAIIGGHYSIFGKLNKIVNGTEGMAGWMDRFFSRVPRPLDAKGNPIPGPQEWIPKGARNLTDSVLAAIVHWISTIVSFGDSVFNSFDSRIPNYVDFNGTHVNIKNNPIYVPLAALGVFSVAVIALITMSNWIGSVFFRKKKPPSAFTGTYKSMRGVPHNVERQLLG